MLWKNTLKYPVLMIGIILFGLYLCDPNTERFWRNHKRRFIPSTCDAVMDRIIPKALVNWELDCPGTQNLFITVTHDKADRNINLLRQDMYKELANTYVNISRFSNPETLKNLRFVNVIIVHPKLKIHSKTDGQAVTELRFKKARKEIAKHLKLTVKVKEISE